MTVTVDGEQVLGTTIDLSEGGAACAIPARGSPPARGSVLELVGGCVEHGDLPVGPQQPKNPGADQAEGKHTPGKIRP